MKSGEGSSTVLVLVVVLFLSAVAVGAMALIGTSALQVRQRLSQEELHRQLADEAGKVVDQLGRSAAPDVDAATDPVWTYIAGRRGSGMDLTVGDLSSRLNLNTVRTELLEKTGLGGLLAPGRSAQELRQLRKDKGPFHSIAAYEPFFSPAVLERDFSVYGYVNLNTSFEDVLRGVYAARTGDSASAETFRGAIRGFLSRQELVKKEQLPALLGLYYPQLYPLMNVEPQMNVNFVPEDVLRAVLSYPYGGKRIEGYEAACQAILADRQQRGLTAQYLADTIHAKGEQVLIFQYLGTRTWFWRIQVRAVGRSLEQVVARLPDETPARFAVLQDRFQ